MMEQVTSTLDLPMEIPINLTKQDVNSDIVNLIYFCNVRFDFVIVVL